MLLCVICLWDKLLQWEGKTMAVRGQAAPRQEGWMLRRGAAPSGLKSPNLHSSWAKGWNISLANAWQWDRGTHPCGCWDKIALQ